MRQGCLLSPKLFNMLLEFVMQEIERMPDEFWLAGENLITNLKYADDTTLISLIFEKLQLATNELHRNVTNTKWNTDKCKVNSPRSEC